MAMVYRTVKRGGVRLLLMQSFFILLGFFAIAAFTVVMLLMFGLRHGDIQSQQIDGFMVWSAAGIGTGMLGTITIMGIFYYRRFREIPKEKRRP
jgi:hypothetical protein